MNRRAPAPRPVSGFTLIEILLAISLLSLILLLLFSALFSANRSWAATEGASRKTMSCASWRNLSRDNWRNSRHCFRPIRMTPT